MKSRRSIAEEILGALWGDDYCRCPGQSLHTNPDGERDCKVYGLDVGAPTCHCFHSSCQGAVDVANHKLRSAIGRAELPERGEKSPRSWKAKTPATWAPPKRAEVDPEALAAEEMAVEAEDALSGILKRYAWDYSESAEIPLDPTEQFERWLELWEPDDTIWIGSNVDSGEWINFAFATRATWFLRGLSERGVQTSSCVFKPGSKVRSNDSVLYRRYLVYESDTLQDAHQRAVLNYLRSGLGLDLRMVVHSGSKSNQGWFDVRGYSPADLNELKAILTGSRPVTQTPRTPSARGWHVGLQGDPAMFVRSQPVRLPGPINPRTGNRQRIVWLKK